MFAVIETGGKQYLVREDQKIKVEKLVSDGKSVVFPHVLLVAGDTVEIGNPFVKGASVEGEVLGNGRSRKVIVFKYHAKARYRKRKGHRQPFTELRIKKIVTK